MSSNFKITFLLLLLGLMISVGLIFIKIETDDINLKLFEYEKAFLYSDNGNFHEAALIFQRYEKDPLFKDSFSYLATYGIALYNLGSIEASQEFFIKAANSYPESLKDNKEFIEYYKIIRGGDKNE